MFDVTLVVDRIEELYTCISADVINKLTHIKNDKNGKATTTDVRIGKKNYNEKFRIVNL